MEDNEIICNCLQVDYITIKEAIGNGANTVQDIAEATGATTACGGCTGRVEEILEAEGKK